MVLQMLCELRELWLERFQLLLLPLDNRLDLRPADFSRLWMSSSSFAAFSTTSLVCCGSAIVVPVSAALRYVCSEAAFILGSTLLDAAAGSFAAFFPLQLSIPGILLPCLRRR